MIDVNTVRQLVEEALQGSDKYLVEATVSKDNQIIVEIDSDSSLSIDDCSELSQFLEKKLDRDVEDYELEVGSAGITSHFRVLRQYQKNIGNEVEVMLKEGGKSTGILSRADENEFELTVKKQVKPEGAKKKITVEENIPFTYDKIRYIKNVIRFK